MGLLQIGSTVDQKTCAAQLSCHIGNLKGDGLLESDGFVELNPFLGIGNSTFKSTLSDAQRLGSDTDTTTIQRSHSNLEALSFFS